MDYIGQLFHDMRSGYGERQIRILNKRTLWGTYDVYDVEVMTPNTPSTTTTIACARFAEDLLRYGHYLLTQ